MKKTTLGKIAGLALCACVCAMHPAMGQTHKAKSSAAKNPGIMSSMIVRTIAPAGNGSDYIKVAFTTTDRVFKLPAKANPEYVKRLKQSMDKHTSVYVFRSSEESDMIQKVLVPGVPSQKKKK